MTLINRSAGGLWRQKKIIIDATSTKDVDSFLLSNFIGVKYILHFRNETQDVFKTIEQLSTKVSGSEIVDTVYGHLGDVINVQANVIKSGSDVFLRVVNNEIYSLNLTISKMITK